MFSARVTPETFVLLSVPSAKRAGWIKPSRVVDDKTEVPTCEVQGRTAVCRDQDFSPVGHIYLPCRPPPPPASGPQLWLPCPSWLPCPLLSHCRARFLVPFPPASSFYLGTYL